MFVVVNFDALAQASDIWIERRQVVFLCWMQDSNPSGSQTPNRQQTECPLTNQLSYRGSSLKTWARQPVPMISEHSAHSTPQPFGIRTWLWRYTCLLLLISMLWHRQAIFESKGDKLSSSAECRIWTQEESNFVVTVPVGTLAPNGASTSASAVPTEKVTGFNSNLLNLS